MVGGPSTTLMPQELGGTGYLVGLVMSHAQPMEPLLRYRVE